MNAVFSVVNKQGAIGVVSPVCTESVGLKQVFLENADSFPL